MAFVVILHLAPAGHSALAELLAQHTRLRVHVAENGMPVEPGHIYVIAPGVYLGIEDGRLTTTPMDQTPVRLPVDRFLRALADGVKDRAVGVVMSGAGSDGSIGVRALKEEGGLTVAQDPREAEYDRMPRSAIETGAVDLVLRARDIPAALINYRKHLLATEPLRAAPAAAEGNGTLAAMIAVLKSAPAARFLALPHRAPCCAASPAAWH